ncbi:DUF6042 family protein [Paenibacillus sp. MY03]|uniref:DUF6042 family protein n=1 Tax=Paenibacillus sp. MY03 TaxID=302980 RepID=UPI00117CA8DB|nr:DUF6042 family protein [Paenibacillus sp. MY03]
MFSFQNEAINFFTNGKATVRVLAQLELIPVGQCAFPNQFHENGWGRWLPMPNITLLPYFSDCVAKEFSREETELFLEQKVRPNTFISFREDCKSTKRENNEDNIMNNRESEVKRRLEANGLQYPSCISDVVGLYLSLKLAHEEHDRQGRSCLDMLIRPLHNIDEVLINP